MGKTLRVDDDMYDRLRELAGEAHRRYGVAPSIANAMRLAMRLAAERMQQEGRK